MYWHRLLEEYFNRYAENQNFYFLPLELSEREAPIVKASLEISTHRIILDDGHYLTMREAQCVYWMRQGKTMKEIGQRLDLSPRTIEYYVKRIKHRLGCCNIKSLLVKIGDRDILSQMRV